MSKRHVKLMEIGPRDGFQSVKEFIPTGVKLEIIEGIIDAGCRSIEITSFVSPKAIPQMQDAEEVAKTILERHPDLELFALVPNFYGATAAVQAGLQIVSPVISLSLSHNQANIRRTHEESLDELRRIRQELPELRIIMDVATVFGCPFEGKMEIPPLLDLLGKLYDTGIREFTLCDTIGIAYPQQVEDVLCACKSAFPDCLFNLHIHDTRNMGMLNTYVGILSGADGVQSALGGLGGCPFAPGASGNTSSEDLVYMLAQNGWESGIRPERLLETAKYLQDTVKGSYSGHHINIGSQQCCTQR